MNNSCHEITIALCMDVSEKNTSIKPLTNAEFYELIAAIDRYNGKDSTSAQLDLFRDNNHSGNSLDYEYLRDVEADFLSEELHLKGDLPSRIVALLARAGALAFEIEKLESQAIRVCSIFNDDYPEKLKSGLKTMPNSLREPPILYCCGDLSIAKSNFVGFVGSRDVANEDVVWAQESIGKIHKKAERDNKIMGVVSGGAEGIDRISEDAAITLIMPVLEYSKNMRTTLKDPKYLDAIMDERLLLISEVNPLRNLSRMEATSHFMNRNKYIYATADYTVVVKSGVGSRSGTWAGASEAIKKKIGKVYVRDIDYAGNRNLIKLGAKPLSNNQSSPRTNDGKACNR